MNFRSFTKTVHDGVEKLEKNFEKDATNASTDPDNAVSHENQVGEDTARSFTNEARKQAQETAAKAEDEAEKLSKDIMEKAAKARRAYNDAVAKTAGKPWPLWKKILFVFGTVTGLVSASAYMGNVEQQKKVDKIAAQTRILQDQIRFSQQITDNLNRTENMMNALRNLPSAPTPLPEVPLPAAVAAVADIPVVVTSEPNDTSVPSEQVSSTVGQVYQRVPQARQQIEQAAPMIEHDYNRQTESHVDLDQHRDDWNRRINEENERRRREDEAYWAAHRTVTVTNGDGSATIRVQAPRQ